jgi:hypothetical protein
VDITRGMKSHPRLPLLHEIYSAVTSALLRAGTASDVGGRLVKVFADAGLPASPKTRFPTSCGRFPVRVQSGGGRRVSAT